MIPKVLVLWLAVPPSARAEATISGTKDLVRIEATDATVEELLLACAGSSAFPIAAESH
jgi:hypothetical protein